MKLQELVGERITHLRKERQLSQQKFSYDANIERTYLTHIEKGRKNISLSTLEKIMNALEITPKDFFNTKEFLQQE
jgi:transcriptional regulator with XRE-family HTH domain